MDSIKAITITPRDEWLNESELEDLTALAEKHDRELVLIFDSEGDPWLKNCPENEWAFQWRSDVVAEVKRWEDDDVEAMQALVERSCHSHPDGDHNEGVWLPGHGYTDDVAARIASIYMWVTEQRAIDFGGFVITEECTSYAVPTSQMPWTVVTGFTDPDDPPTDQHRAPKEHDMNRFDAIRELIDSTGSVAVPFEDTVAMLAESAPLRESRS